ncbi:MAG TPA: ABC transporter permease [Streptosporangiaceae bacterium]|jgi:ABC-type transport system involved in multi-copper enzyme maturation permease subunit|nr:ABC transporter permease [Streptosporangiaceae bacterium]
MSALTTIAALTMREALRRRLIAALAVICLALVGLSSWGFYRLSHGSSMTSGEVNGALPTAFILFMFMFSFIVALSASAIASPSVSTEIESGVLQAVVTRPVRRRDVILGKWLGLAVILAVYTVVVVGLQVAVVRAVSGFMPPQPVTAAAYLFGEGAVLLTLVLLLSTRLSALAAGVAGVALFGIAWLAGVVGGLGEAFNIPALHTASQVSQYIVPTDGLWHGAIFYLEPASYLSLQLSEAGDRGSPFFAAAAPSWGYLAWAGVWFVLVLALSVASFERREL